MRRRLLAGGVVWLVVGTAVADAQPPALRPGRPLVAVGGAWLGGEGLGTVRAETRAVAIGTTAPPPSTLFTTTSRLDAAPALEATVTVPITPGWAIEARGALRRPTLTATITGDAEATGTFTATEDVAEYTVEASVLYHPPWGAIGRRARAFLLAGGGYLRQLHDIDALVETGTSAHVGAGARLWLTGGGGRGLAAGLIGDVRWVLRRDGITFADGARSVPALALRAFVGF